ncbi:restriction endonuclease subunit S [Methanobrevibacter arboriphilus]|uniref:restriction endonuclease subunit S n=1 Tax=Methanobrevibacter arboriphilus TaxID=39441 RepID=UPI0009DD13E7|nr:restriction endonuclease subunit S [Methanobrevibacter arboriphilus]
MKLKQYSKYKSSGSDFFENIPVEWNISKLKFLISSLESGKRENIDLLTDDDNTVFSLGGEHINWNGTLNLKNKRFVSENYYNSMNNGKIAENDILLVKDGATIGKTAFVKNKPYSKMAVNEHVFIIRSNNKIESKLLYYLISSDIGFTQIKLTETGSAQGGINSEFISQVNFPLNYDKEEQTKISNFLDKKIEDMDSLIAKNKN